jgi:hypothetical protein
MLLFLAGGASAGGGPPAELKGWTVGEGGGTDGSGEGAVLEAVGGFGSSAGAVAAAGAGSAAGAGVSAGGGVAGCSVGAASDAGWLPGSAGFGVADELVGSSGICKEPSSYNLVTLYHLC